MKRSTSDPVETIYTNPLKIYNEYLNRADTINNSGQYSGNKYKYGPNSIGYYPSNAGNFLAEGQVSDKYGVKVLNSKEYEFLSSLGLDENSTPQQINAALNDYILHGGVDDYYGEVNMTNYNQISKNLRNNYRAIRSRDASSAKSLIQEFDLKTGMGAKGTEILEDDLDAGINGIYYSRKNPDKLIADIGTGRFVIDPSLIDTETRNIIESRSPYIKMDDETLCNFAVRQGWVAPEDIYSVRNTANAIRSQLEKEIKEALYYQFNSANPTQSETASIR